MDKEDARQLSAAEQHERRRQVTVPGDGDRPVPARHVFAEYAEEGRLFLEDELRPGNEYEVVVTTASGLYRYRTGDWVRHDGYNRRGSPILEFIGRDGLTCDLVGEKLTEPFVSRCLAFLPGFSLLLPEASRPGYVLVSARGDDASALARVEESLCANPQYAYARKLGQLARLRGMAHPDPFPVVALEMLGRGVRLGDVKPLALRREASRTPRSASTARSASRSSSATCRGTGRSTEWWPWTCPARGGAGMGYGARPDSTRWKTCASFTTSMPASINFPPF